MPSCLTCRQWGINKVSSASILFLGNLFEYQQMEYYPALLATLACTVDSWGIRVRMHTIVSKYMATCFSSSYDVALYCY